MCVFKFLFGLPCPGCGLTRANLLFFTGNFYEAFLMHPLFLLADVFLLYLIWFFLIKREKGDKTVLDFVPFYDCRLLNCVRPACFPAMGQMRAVYL